MKSASFKKALPHIIAVVLFLIVALIYCKPALEGKVVSQHDIQGWKGMAQQSFEFKEKYGHFPLWTNSMFGGMPAYQIAMDAKTAISIHYIQEVITLGMPKPINFFFLACLGFYFLCIIARANPWAAILGAFAYSYSTFDPIIVAVGHDTQMVSIGLAPFVLAGILLLFQRKYLWGFAVTTLFSALLIGQSHLQIVYYTFIIAVIMVIAFLIKQYKEKEIAIALKGTGLALVAGLIGLAVNAVSMMPTYEYSKESMRGGRSELTIGDNIKTKGGLDKDYAFRYSFGFGETFTFIVPGLYGGSNGGDEYNESANFVQKFSELGVPEDQAVQYANSLSYWGEQPGTSGPVYFGAIICLLFIFGAVYVKSWHKWWLSGASAFGLLLAYGTNVESINYFLFDYLPLYNKFRAPTMALVIPQLCFPMMAVLAVNQLIHEKDLNGIVLKKLKLTAIITGAVFILLILFYTSASFTGPNDKSFKGNIEQNVLSQVPPGQQAPPAMVQQAQQISQGIVTALQKDRKSLMGSDLLRSLILVLIALGLIYFFVKKKVSATVLLAGMIIMSTFDLLGIATRYLNASKFVEESDFESAFIPSPADQLIMKDPDHGRFRVFNQTVDAFNDATTSYHHNSVGGYHPAKLGLYNDIITHQLSKGNMEVFNMLNTRYFIVMDPQTRKPVAQRNPGAFGNAWLVDGVKFVETPDEEMLALNNTQLRDTAVVENKFKGQIKSLPTKDSTAFIQLKDYENDRISYAYQSASPSVAIFSEVYYPYGWQAFVDGKVSDYFKTDYLLRGMYLPAGQHEIEFKFDPQSYSTGRMITIIATILVYLLVIAAFVREFIVRRKD